MQHPAVLLYIIVALLLPSSIWCMEEEHEGEHVHEREHEHEHEHDEAENHIVVLQGAGASLPNELYRDATTAYSRIQDSASVSYVPLSSTKGKCRIKDYLIHCSTPLNGNGTDTAYPRNLDFASSESILTSEEYTQYPDIQLYPAVASAVAPIYNIPGVRDLVLTPQLLSRIFRQCDDNNPDCLPGSIHYWNNSEIVALNSNAEEKLQAAGRIQLITRAESSGTTEILKKSLAQFDPDFGTQVGTSTSAEWKGVIQTQAKSLTGMSAIVASTPGTIAYSPLSIAKRYQLDTARIGSSVSSAVSASAITVTNTILEVGENFGNNGDDPAHLTCDLFGAKGLNSWPIAGYSYFVIRKDFLRNGASCEHRRETAKFLEWFYTDPIVSTLGQKYGLATLPIALAKRIAYSIVSELHCPSIGQAYIPLHVPPIQVHHREALNSELLLSAETFNQYIVPSSRFNLQADDSETNLMFLLNAVDSMTSSSGLQDDQSAVVAIVNRVSVLNNWERISQELQNRNIALIPYVSTPYVARCNLCGVDVNCPYTNTRLSLQPSVLARILSGEISYWNHQDIANSNMGIPLPDAAINIVELDNSVGMEWRNTMLPMLRRYHEGFNFATGTTVIHTIEQLLRTMLVTPFTLTVCPGSVGEQESVISIPIQISEVVVPFSSPHTMACAEYQMEPYHTTSDWKTAFESLPEPAHTLDSNTLCYPFTDISFLLFTSNFVGHCDDPTVSVAKSFAGYIEWITQHSVSHAYEAVNLGFLADLRSHEDSIATRVECNGSSVLKPSEDLSLVTDDVSGVIVALTWCAVTLCLLLALWTIQNRKHTVIRRTSVSFLLQILLGSCAMLFTNLLFVVQEPTDFNEYDEVTKSHIVDELSHSCTQIPLLWSSGFCICYTPMILKSWSVVKRFKHRKLRKVITPSYVILSYQAVLGMLFLTINVIWQLSDPLRWERTPLVIDERGNVLVSSAICNCDNPWIWVGVLLTIILTYLLYGNFLARKGANIPVSMNEGKWIGFALSNMLQLLVFVTPVLRISQKNPSTLALLRGLANLISVGCTLAFVYIPKIYFWITNDFDLSKSHKLKTRSPKQALRKPNGKIWSASHSALVPQRGSFDVREVVLKNKY